MLTPPPSRRSWATRAVNSLFSRQRALSRSERRRRKTAPVEELEDRALLATFTVTNGNNDGFGSLRAAIAQADALAGLDDIEFNIAAGDTVTVTESLALTTDVQINGTNLVTDNPVTIQAGSTNRLFFVEATVATLQDLTLSGGRPQRDPDADPVDLGDGGAIWNAAGTLTLNNVVLENNAAPNRGGAIFSQFGTLTLNGSQVIDNVAATGGGIAVNGGTAGIFDSSISGNQAVGEVGDPGDPDADPPIPPILPVAGHGGGLRLDGGQVEVVRSTVSSNTAVADGGGVYNELATLTSAESTWSGNQADNGGAIFSTANTTTELRNTTVSGNLALATARIAAAPNGNLFRNGFGGGIFNQSALGSSPAVLTVTNSTITQNTAFEDVVLDDAGVLVADPRGAGIYNDDENNTAGVLRLFNSIVAGNTVFDSAATVTPDDLRGGLVNEISEHNIIGDAASSGGLLDNVTSFNIIGDDGVGTLVTETFLDGTLANNGGGTLTHALLPRSIAVDAGVNNRAAEAGDNSIPDIVDGDVALENDQRGFNPFFRIHDDIVDIGAYEVQPFIVDTIENESDGDLSRGDVSLREAIEIANQSPVEDSIAFAIDDIFNPVIEIDAQYLVDTDIVIRGRNLSGGGFVTVDGAGDGRILTVLPSEDGVAPRLVLEDLTFTNGHANGSDGGLFSTDGGAILNVSSVLEVFNFGLRGNTADSFGGALSVVEGGSVSSVNTTVSGNTAEFSGGGFFSNNSRFTSVNSTITGNEAGVSGGGIASTTNATVEIRLYNSIVAGNLASGLPEDLSGQAVETDAAHNLIGSAANAGGIAHAVRGNIVGNLGLGNLDITTVLEPVSSDNGGAGETHVLVANSPALNAGDNNLAARPGLHLADPMQVFSSELVPSAIANDEELDSDARSNPFTRVADGTTDIGAYEGQVLNLVVDNSLDELDGDFGDQDFSLREAILLANQNPGFDFINFDVVSTVQIVDQLVLTSSVQIDGAITNGRTTLAGVGNGRLFLVDASDNPVNSTFQNLNFTNGNANGSDGGLTPESGGAILSRFATVEVLNSNFANNLANDSGGAYYNEDGVLSVVDTTFTNNSAGILGGGIANDDGTVDVLTSTFFSNTAGTNGGAIFNNNGPLTVVNSTVSDNSANVDGGGIYNEDDTTTVVNTTIVNNTADADNNGTGEGGGLQTVDDTVTFTNLFNTLLAGNHAGTIANDLGGKTPTLVSSNNLIADAASSAGLVDGANGNIVGIDGSGTIPLGSIVDPLASNGGPVQTHSLNPTSPAINAGNSNQAALPGSDLIPDVADGDVALTQDQRGFPFSRISAGAVDIGSYEVISVWTVDTDSDIDDGDYTAGNLSLREAIFLANETPAAVTIQFNIPLVAPVISVGAELVVDTDVVIDGTNLNAAGGTITLDGEGTGRILKVDGDITPASLGLTNLTLTGGNADGTNPAPFNEEGGAVFGLSADIQVSNTTFINNDAGEGGAILTRTGSLIVENSTFTSNDARNAGAILSFGTDTTITDSTFTGNRAADAGGTILVRSGTASVAGSTISNSMATDGGAGATQSGGNLFFTNSTISGNTATDDGGAIANTAGFAVLTNTTVTGNFANGAGGGIWTASFSGTRLFNTIVAGNEATNPANPASPMASDLSGAVIAISSNNLIGDAGTAGGLVDATNGNIVGNDGVGTIPITTILNPTLASNGGLVTFTHALVPGSPAIDAGDSNRAALPGSNGIPDASADGDDALVFDQRQTPYSRTTGNADIGSYEVTTDWLISTNDDVVDGSFGPGLFSLREAIETANGNPGVDTISFGIGLSRTSIQLGGQELEITDDLVINGLGAASTTIDAAGLDRILKVAPDTTLTLRNLRLTGGMTDEAGGAIFSEGHLILEDVIVDGNTANSGGALKIEGSADIKRSLFTNNTAVFGGAIDSDAGQLTTRLENVTISGNTATGTSGALAGAGIHVHDAVFDIVSSTIANNTSSANGEGAGIAVDIAGSTAGILSLVNSIVADNVSGAVGIDVAGDVAQLRHSLIETDAGFTRTDLGGNLFVDPELGPLAVNNGQSATHELSISSPALNTGDDAAVTFSTDQTGQPRQIGSVDIGADERLILTAVDDAANTSTASSVTIDVLGNDTPATNTEIRAITSDPTLGTAVIDSGQVTYTPDGTQGTDSFTYELGLETQVENGPIDSEFGHSVAVDGDWMVIGAQSEDGDNPDGGAAFVYRRSGGVWSLFQQLDAQMEDTLDRFGFDVAIEGTTIVVGARMDDDMGRNAGAAYVFEFDATEGLWLESAKLLDTETGSEKDQFGHAVAIQGDTIVIGSRLDDGQGRNGGSIFIFERTATGWTTEGRIKNEDQARGDQFGYDVAIDGDTIVVGARKDNTEAGIDSGSVFVYQNNGSEWVETTRIIGSTTRTNSWFGHAVSISGDSLAVGTPQRLSRFRAGEAFVFERNNGGADNYGESVMISDPGQDPEQDNFGFSIAIEGDTLAIGSRRDDSVTSNGGTVYLHNRDAGGTEAWGLASQVNAPNSQSGDNFGRAVGLDSETLVVGASVADAGTGNDNSGFAYFRDLATASATVTVDIASPLLATEIGTNLTADLTADQLAPIVDAATDYWLNTPLTPAQQHALNSASVTIGTLDGAYLGLAFGESVIIDADAAGHRWSLDQTQTGAGEIDLFTTVLHELGHVIGFGDTYAAADSQDIMYGYLSPGESRANAVLALDASPADDLATDLVFGQLAHDDDLIF